MLKIKINNQIVRQNLIQVMSQKTLMEMTHQIRRPINNHRISIHNKMIKLFSNKRIKPIQSPQIIKINFSKRTMLIFNWKRNQKDKNDLNEAKNQYKKKTIVLKIYQFQLIIQKYNLLLEREKYPNNKSIVLCSKLVQIRRIKR